MGTQSCLRSAIMWIKQLLLVALIGLTVLTIADADPAPADTVNDVAETDRESSLVDRVVALAGPQEVEDRDDDVEEVEERMPKKKKKSKKGKKKTKRTKKKGGNKG